MSMRTFVFVTLLVAAGSAANAQSIGTFRWQMQPYCNVLTLTVTQNSGVYTLDGFDDQCGAATVAPLTGTAVPNPNGTIELGLNIVASPDGAPVHVAVPLSIATLGGTWQDSADNTGNFVFTPGAGIGGNPRPAIAGGVAPGSITSASIATNAVGSQQVDASQVQLRIGNACPGGTFIQSVAQNGSVSCAAEAGDITSVSAGNGLSGGASSGAVNLSLPVTTNGAFSFTNPSGLVATGSLGSGSIPVSGAGTRAMWYPAKAAFRAGEALGAEWDDANVGHWSTAFGHNVTASGAASMAAGGNAYALGADSVALGFNVAAVGASAVALGNNARSETGAFTFADHSVDAVFASGPNQFNVRSVGGVGFYTKVNLTAGVELAPGASSWSSVSDVNMKEHFKDLDSEDVLAKLARMPIREWNYKAQDAAIRHVGPTAQDFHAAFGLGEDPLRISTIDADGIALAGVKALALENRALQMELASLRERLERLERKQP